MTEGMAAYQPVRNPSSGVCLICGYAGRVWYLTYWVQGQETQICNDCLYPAIRRAMNDPDYREHREFTVLRRVADRWEPVGLPGSLEFVKGEMADWRRDAPDAVLAYGQRDVGPWTLGDES